MLLADTCPVPQPSTLGGRRWVNTWPESTGSVNEQINVERAVSAGA